MTDDARRMHNFARPKMAHAIVVGDVLLLTSETLNVEEVTRGTPTTQYPDGHVIVSGTDSCGHAWHLSYAPMQEIPHVVDTDGQTDYQRWAAKT